MNFDLKQCAQNTIKRLTVAAAITLTEWLCGWSYITFQRRRRRGDSA